jgi:hypothetical protein
MTAMPAPTFVGVEGFVRMREPRNREERRAAVRAAATRAGGDAEVISLVQRRADKNLDRELALFADEMRAWADTSIEAAADIWPVD